MELTCFHLVFTYHVPALTILLMFLLTYFYFGARWKMWRRGMEMIRYSICFRELYIQCLFNGYYITVTCKLIKQSSKILQFLSFFVLNTALCLFAETHPYRMENFMLRVFLMFGWLFVVVVWKQQIQRIKFLL